jgi:hypothetical protein
VLGKYRQNHCADLRKYSSRRCATGEGACWLGRGNKRTGGDDGGAAAAGRDTDEERSVEDEIEVETERAESSSPPTCCSLESLASSTAEKDSDEADTAVFLSTVDVFEGECFGVERGVERGVIFVDTADPGIFKVIAIVGGHSPGMDSSEEK